MDKVIEQTIVEGVSGILKAQMEDLAAAAGIYAATAGKGGQGGAVTAAPAAAPAKSAEGAALAQAAKTGAPPAGPAGPAGSPAALSALAPQELADAISKAKASTDYMSQFGYSGGKDPLMDSIKALSNIADAWGAGRLAYAGRDSPTRLQKQYNMLVESQRQANADIATLQRQLSMVNPEMKKNIIEAINANNLKYLVDVGVFKDTFEGQMMLERLKNWINLTNNAVGAKSSVSPYSIGQQLVGADITGGGHK